jgi:hypothetical protein
MDLMRTGANTYSKIRNIKWIGHVLRMNCLLKHVIEWNIDGWI